MNPKIAYHLIEILQYRYANSTDETEKEALRLKMIEICDSATGNGIPGSHILAVWIIALSIFDMSLYFLL